MIDSQALKQTQTSARCPDILIVFFADILASINKFLIAAGNSEQFDGNATVDTALQKLGLKDQYQLLPGMSVALMAHQIIGQLSFKASSLTLTHSEIVGVAWMIDKEKGSHMLQGGILADEMGLG